MMEKRSRQGGSREREKDIKDTQRVATQHERDIMGKFVLSEKGRKEGTGWPLTSCMLSLSGRPSYAPGDIFFLGQICVRYTHTRDVETSIVCYKKKDRRGGRRGRDRKELQGILKNGRRRRGVSDTELFSFWCAH